MSSSEEKIRSTHLDLSQADWRFREYAQSREECLKRETYELLDRPNLLLSYRLQSWPTFIRKGTIARFAELSLHVARLIRQVPSLVFDNDPKKISEAYGIYNPTTLELLLDEPTGIETTLSRGDFIDTDDGMKCIEFNFTPSLGGWETSILAEMHLGIAPTARFVEEVGLDFTFTNTVGTLFEHILRTVENRGIPHDGEVNTAMVVTASEGTVIPPEFTAYFNSEYSQVCRRHDLGGEMVLCFFSELKSVGGRLYRGDQPIHAVIELADEETDQEVYRCFKRGNLCLLNGPVSAILTSKFNVAFLSELADEGGLEEEDAERVRRHVPWTRRVTPQYVTYHGEMEFLPDLLLSRQEELVLKDVHLYGGKGVALGRATPPERWSQLVDSALGTGKWIVQELVHSRPYLYQAGEQGCSSHDVIWGPFVFGDHYAGLILRMQPQAVKGAVNLSLHATEGIVFEVPDSQ